MAQRNLMQLVIVNFNDMTSPVHADPEREREHLSTNARYIHQTIAAAPTGTIAQVIGPDRSYLIPHSSAAPLMSATTAVEALEQRIMRTMLARMGRRDHRSVLWGLGGASIT